MLPILNHAPRPHAYLYRLTVQFKDHTSDVYAMATSVATAFQVYLDRRIIRHENAVEVLLIHGELANPMRLDGPVKRGQRT